MNEALRDELIKLPNIPYWYERTDERPSLNTEIDADVVIIGAGYTGLWTAYYLLKTSPSLRVVILEREYAGFGASGRNGGWASAIFPISLSKVAKNSSHQSALFLQQVMNETVDEIGQILQLEGIDANYSKDGFLSIARTQAQLQRAKSSVKASKDFGLPDQWYFLDAKATKSKINVANALGAIYTPHCAVIHPGKLVRGLAKTVEKLGAKIYEKSAVTKINSGQVTTLNGIVKAPIIVKATESYSCQLDGYKRSIIPLYSLVLATEPIPVSVRNDLKLNHRLAFNDMRHLRVYAQMTADGRLIFGGRGAPYHYGSTISPEFDLVDNVHESIRSTINDFFPTLRSLKITHRWGGALGVARDWSPSVGFDPNTGIAWGGHYVGDGVAMSNLSGRILKNLILNIQEPINKLPIVNHASPLWEPEPLRWMGINFGLSATAFADKEENMTNRPSTVASALEALTGAH
ncbi:NAD(P)/FAD-dependent oxidoreductase [Acinetobacter baumannii]|uniref:NAD(P)/FAD-dependent oxidoreductase n=1 Tax=Acinetobacter baumannii TaxID=470 RepID=UPI001BCC755E|nr:FAD-dependent oxidoreductase [Acinetobacter baumannii]EKU5238414.1 FAD-dependent oxidoreductase [Acinetobacter baumannii]EKU5242176.1 FAD-dependent oxidoreductase [Acinetobacter baumannii]